MWTIAWSILIFHVALFRCQKYQDLQLLFVNGKNSWEFEAFYFNETSNLLTHPDFNNNRTTILYSYGYTENFLRSSTQTILAAYISRGNHNLLVIEWSKYSDGYYYFEAIPNAQAVGAEVGKHLLRMKSEGFNLENFHLVGHSLGAQLMGYIGRSYYKNSSNKFKITKITALDPSGPLFYGINEKIKNPLNKDDAKIVHVIHTDSNFLGTSKKSGHADFWPNGGKNQPGCPNANWNIYQEENFCSHRRSWMYFSESVESMDHKSFSAVPCDSWENFQANNCPENQTSKQDYMGYYASNDITGDYFLQTNPDSPFYRGLIGMYYDESIDTTNDNKTENSVE